MVFTLASACGSAAVPAPQLPLRRVVVYRNGVGYFERAGHVRDAEVTFRMRQSAIGDFLATMAIVERGDSSVRSASFPVELDEPRPAPGAPHCRPRVDGTPPLGTCVGFEATSGTCQEPGEDPLRQVTLRLDGREHRLAVGYIAPIPLWRPSYRVVVGTGGQARLQAWGIVQNLSGEDWIDVELVLVAGAPLAFRSTLGQPMTPPRPIVTDAGEGIATLPRGVTNLSPPAPGAPGEGAGGQLAPGSAGDAAGGGARVGAATVDATQEHGETTAARHPGPSGATAVARDPGPSGATAAARDVAAAGSGGDAPVGARIAPPDSPAQASGLAVAMAGSGETRYSPPHRVTVPSGSATMVLLASREVPGETVYLFAPDPGVSASMAHPFRVAHFRNATTGLLERGPVAVYERGAFLGQGMLEPLPVGATATVPFALERGIGVVSETHHDQRGARLYRIERGTLTVDRDQITRTTYHVRNATAATAKVLVRHLRSPGTRLFRPAPGTEESAGAAVALVPLFVEAGVKTKLVVDERRPAQFTVDWLSPLAGEAITAYLTDPSAEQAVVDRLEAAWKLREAWRVLEAEKETLTTEEHELRTHTGQLRDSLEAVEKNPQAADLRTRLSERLERATTRLDAITRRAVELGVAVREQQIRFNDAILEIEAVRALPPVN